MISTEQLKTEYFKLIKISDELNEKLIKFENSLLIEKPSIEWKIKTEVDIKNTRRELDEINKLLAEIKLMLSRLGEI